MQSRKLLLWNRMFHKGLVHFPLFPYQCRVWSVEWGAVQSVECEDSDNSKVLSGEPNVKDMKWGLRGAKCRV